MGEFERSGGSGAYYQKLKILTVGNELPDMFDAEGGALTAEIAAAGVLKDIDELYREISYASKETDIGHRVSAGRGREVLSDDRIGAV
jgi:hypothetical protein